MDIRNGNCLELMKTVPDKSVDLFICDLPYGETNCKWDCKIDMEAFWSEFKRVRKSPRTACIHFCSTKFGYTLIKSWEKGYKMDMVWKKRNKTGGLQSRHRPMRNHEMVYFFYDQAPKYNRDKYHKRIKSFPAKKENGKDALGHDNIGVTIKESGFASNFDPPNPASVLEEPKNKTIKATDRKAMGESSGIYSKENQTASSFEPPNPASVVEEEEDTMFGETKEERHKRYLKSGTGEYEPPNPASVVEEEDKPYGKACGGKGFGATKNNKDFKQSNFEPPNPASVVEEKCLYGFNKKDKQKYAVKDLGKNHAFDPPNPASVVEEPEPVSMFESTKVFIGKRHHQTEKPQDILEFFLKYWTDEDDVVLDPTMGSGSTGVACKKLNRKFIGFELDPKIYEVAKKRIANL